MTPRAAELIANLALAPHPEGGFFREVHRSAASVTPGDGRPERAVEGTPLGTVLFDVVAPTLTAFLPEPDKATGTGIIIAPGGAFVALAIDHEGHDVARWLRQRGIAACVLKRRTVQNRGEGIPAMDMDTAGRHGIADGIQALKVVREHAAEWGVAPGRLGMIGFSAGAMVASAALLQEDAAARPDFAAMIYGGPFGKMPPIPAELLPMFLAWARDDELALGAIERFHDALRAAGHEPEVHIYAAGGHGFGMRAQGASSVSDGDVWVRRWPVGGGDRSIYDVFARSGEFRNTVVLPRAIHVEPTPFLSAAAVVGVTADVLTGESVVLRFEAETSR